MLRDSKQQPGEAEHHNTSCSSQTAAMRLYGEVFWSIKYVIFFICF